MSVVVLSVIVIWLVSRPGRGGLAFAATVGGPVRAATSPWALFPAQLHAASRLDANGPPRTARSARARGYRDPLARHRATVGPDVRTSLLVRIRAVILLALIVAAIGAAIAGATLLLIASGRFLLELLAG